MPVILFLAFVFFSLLSWLMLFRDLYIIEVLGRSFYPDKALFISQIQNFLSPFKVNTSLPILLLLFVLISFMAYLAALRQQKRYSVRKIIVCSILFQIIVFFSYPILSNDIINYINTDRLAVVYNQNVWQTTPDKYSKDSFYWLTGHDYRTVTKVYGPVNQVFYSAVTSLSGDDFFINIAWHKLVVIVFVVALIFLANQIAREFFANSRADILKAIFWNPLFVLETAGSGHNDPLMLFFLGLTIYLYLRRRFLASGLALGLSLGVKTTPILVIPFLAVDFLRRKQIRPAIVFFSGLVFILAWLAYFMGTGLTEVVRRTLAPPAAYGPWQSLPLLIQKISPVLAAYFPYLFGLVGLWFLVKTWQSDSPWENFLKIILIYLSLFLSVFWNWYPLWPLVIAALIFSRKLLTISQWFTFSSLLAYPVYYIVLRFDFLRPVWDVIVYVVILSGPVLGFFKSRQVR